MAVFLNSTGSIEIISEAIPTYKYRETYAISASIKDEENHQQWLDMISSGSASIEDMPYDENSNMNIVYEGENLNSLKSLINSIPKSQ